MESNTKDLEGYIRTKKNNLKTQILRTASGALAIATILGALASCEKNVPVGPVDDSSKTVTVEPAYPNITTDITTNPNTDITTNPNTDITTPNIDNPIEECVDGKEHNYEITAEPCAESLNEITPNSDGTNVCSGDGLQRYYKCSRCGQAQPGGTVIVTPYKKHVPGTVTKKRLFDTSKCTTCNKDIIYTDKDECWRTWIRQVL